MLELIFVFFIVPKRMTALARERGRSAFKWTLAASGAWLGVEIALISLTLLVIEMLRSTGGWDGDLGGMAIFVYAGPLVAGMVACDRVKKALESIPTIDSLAETSDNQPDRTSQ